MLQCPQQQIIFFHVTLIPATSLKDRHGASPSPDEKSVSSTQNDHTLADWEFPANVTCVCLPDNSCPGWGLQGSCSCHQKPTGSKLRTVTTMLIWCSERCWGSESISMRRSSLLNPIVHWIFLMDPVFTSSRFELWHGSFRCSTAGSGAVSWIWKYHFMGEEQPVLFLSGYQHLRNTHAHLRY